MATDGNDAQEKADRLAQYTFWKEAAIGLSAVMFAVAGSWFAFGKDAVSQAQVRNLIAQTSPYALDRSKIAADLAREEHEIQTLEADQQAFADRQANVRERLAALEATLKAVEHDLALLERK